MGTMWLIVCLSRDGIDSMCRAMELKLLEAKESRSPGEHYKTRTGRTEFSRIRGAFRQGTAIHHQTVIKASIKGGWASFASEGRLAPV